MERDRFDSEDSQEKKEDDGEVITERNLIGGPPPGEYYDDTPDEPSCFGSLVTKIKSKLGKSSK
eukprot:snap_masked-scaffold_56-processed-gene-1.32-mRNA-1 protein AED:1.00 eAED:1.00 QI:0/-1/0/0/-1/1/1/0/63